MFRLIGCCFLLFGYYSVFCQIQQRPVAVAALPKTIVYKGKVREAFRYTDKTGTYLALATQTGIENQKSGEDNRQAHLYGYVYPMGDTLMSSPLWQLQDGVTDCLLDVLAFFIPNTFAVTDLNGNGIAEVWMMYRLGCRGDVSPADTKIIMHEGSVKYAMRGEGKIKAGNEVMPGGGKYTFDEAFAKAPAAMRQYAEQLWKKNEVETVE